MPDSTQQQTSGSSLFGDILNAAQLVLSLRQSGQTPNFYPAPLTPTEQWTSDAKKNLFDYASAYSDQYLRGLGNLNPDFQLNTSAVGNPAFMGGVKVPQIDWSKMPSRPGTGATATSAPPKGPGLSGEGSGPTGVAGDPFGHITSPAGGPGDPFAGLPDQSATAHNVTWDDIKKFGPAAVKLGQVLFGQGIPIETIFNFIRSKFGSGGGGQQLPVNDLSGSVDLTPDSSTYQRLQFPRGGGYATGPDGQVVQVIGPGNPEYKPVNYSPRDPLHMYDPGTGISGGIVQPEGQGHGQGGFGPYGGWGYDGFYAGGGGKYRP